MQKSDWVDCFCQPKCLGGERERVCVSLCGVCVCVCEREREREAYALCMAATSTTVEDMLV